MSSFSSDPWSDDEIATLRRCYELEHGYRAAAVAALPHRSPGSIASRVWALGIARPRTRKPPAPPKPKAEPKHAKYGASVPIAAPIATGPVAVPKPEPQKPVEYGPECDRGDREYIRRRMPHIVDTLARETRKSPRAVVRCLVALAKQNFEPDKIALLSTDREEILTASLGASTAVKRPPSPARLPG